MGRPSTELVVQLRYRGFKVRRLQKNFIVGVNLFQSKRVMPWELGLIPKGLIYILKEMRCSVCGQLCLLSKRNIHRLGKSFSPRGGSKTDNHHITIGKGTTEERAFITA